MRMKWIHAFAVVCGVALSQLVSASVVPSPSSSPAPRLTAFATAMDVDKLKLVMTPIPSPMYLYFDKCRYGLCDPLPPWYWRYIWENYGPFPLPKDWMLNNEKTGSAVGQGGDWRTGG